MRLERSLKCSLSGCCAEGRLDQDFEMLMKKRLPTLCAGVALGLILIMEFQFKRGYLHNVLMSNWI